MPLGAAASLVGLSRASLPIHSASGAIQDLQVVAVGQAPVDTCLLGLSRLPFGVIHADSANLGTHGVMGEREPFQNKGLGAGRQDCWVRSVRPWSFPLRAALTLPWFRLHFGLRAEPRHPKGTSACSWDPSKGFPIHNALYKEVCVKSK